MFSKKNKVVSTAVLKVKNVGRDIVPGSMPFEEYISSSNTAIKIEFPDGKMYMEKEYEKTFGPIQKFYIEFYEELFMDHLMKFLLDEHSNYRVTSMDGTILRLSREDQKNVSGESEMKEDQKLKEFVVVEEKKSFLQRFKRLFQKKDN